MATGNTIKLYKFPLVIALTQTDHGIEQNNMPFGDSDFKIYRGAHTPVEFVVRDNDRKPVPLVGRCVTMTIIDFHTKLVKLQKNAQVIDGPKGRIRVTFDPQEIVNLPAGFYRYTMLLANEDNTNNLLYIDKDQRATGFFELIENVLPELVESGQILSDQFTPVNETPPTTSPTIFISGACPADSALCEKDGLHTVVVYTTNYVGKFFVQGSLETSPTSEDKEWFDISLTSFTPFFEFGNTPNADSTFTGLEAFNFTANIRWIRFKHIPDDDNPGSLDQVLFRS